MNRNESHPCVLLTGATGFLGAQIARRLIPMKNLTIIALVRAEDDAAAMRRLARAWWDWPELTDAFSPVHPQTQPDHGGPQVEVLAGDVSLPRLGLDGAAYARLAWRITHIIHSAADLRLNGPLDELRKTNVQGTVNLLELARQAHSTGRLARFAHISTAYVAGRRPGVIQEGELSGAHGFTNAYEQTKFEAECLVDSAKTELPISVFRPGMIVGASDSGEIRTFNTVYYPLKLYLSGKFALIPVDPALQVNLVPVDYVAESVVRLTFSPEAEGQTFHLTAPTGSLPTARELVDFVRGWAKEQLGLRLPRPVFVRLPLFLGKILSGREGAQQSKPAGQRQTRSNLRELNHLRTLQPYFYDSRLFHRENTDRLLGAYPLDWRIFLPRLLAYAVRHCFVHRTERTVHEQILARLGSRTRPIEYFDIVEGKTIPRSGAEVRAEILRCAAALTSLGVQPGERVAIVGLNSSRYLALETAIGLVGAVSVPLYFTSPAAEIEHILAASGARLLLVGAPRIRAQLSQIRVDLPVVDFCREQGRIHPGREVISWDAFLALGAGIEVPARAPVGFGDLATLRYTSGTTGSPKGVGFQHQHLRWMGETMTSLMPMSASQPAARYLSCLPMSHVVEGILANYSPYYTPVPVKIYFLEDIYSLPEALPRVRPTIFFSVPRIYEKIWAAVERNPVGRWFTRLPAGFLKTAVGALLRWRTLKKAGLDRCVQLLTGSAPCGEGLLRNFRELGVEIYNAYGLTEAPLVAFNRIGANRLGTVGTPLPETEIRIAEDGEVLVRGPQVMAGYYNGKSGEAIQQPFRDGWLLTGDLGRLTPEGGLALTGRKKELIKTSYGKYVQPTRVETRLREIPGVAEAMLVGEQRPYCVALLWVDGKSLDPQALERLDQRVGEVNQGLSHPEQVKRWAVMSNDLSTESGSLTANLKLKRQAIFKRHADVLESLYDGLRPRESVLHFGEAVKD